MLQLTPNIPYLDKAGKNDCQVASQKLLNLKQLNLQNSGISDLRALSTFTNLENLNLHNNEIVNINPLGKMINLENVNRT